MKTTTPAKRTAAPAAVKTMNENPLRNYAVSFEGRSSVIEAVCVQVNGNHYTFIGQDDEPCGFFPTDRTGIVRLS